MDNELNIGSNIFNDTGKDHDFSENEKEHIVKTLNHDMNEGEDFCTRKDVNTENLSASGRAANAGDCLEKHLEDESTRDRPLYGSLKKYTKKLG